MTKLPCESGFTYAARVADIPFMYRRKSGLKLLFAFTDRHFSSEVLQKTQPIELSNLNDALLREILTQVVGIYETAYGQKLHLTSEDTQQIFRDLSDTKQQLRRFIKGCVELLDFIQFDFDGMK